MEGKKIRELERYLNSYIQRHPRTVAASIGGAFLDVEYRGDLSAAAAKLQGIQSAISTGSISSSNEFKDTVVIELATLTHLADRFLSSSGLTRADLKGKADPVKTREFYGSELPSLLKLLKLAPDAQLP